MIPLNILLADDSESLATYLCELLRNNGHTVNWVRSGEDALNAYETNTPEMVLIDLEMPGIGGLEAIKRMKKIQTDSWVPIIVITGHTGDEDILSSFMAGADDFIAKPINPLAFEIRLQSLTRITDIQRKAALLMDSVIDAVIKIDPAARIIAFNRAAEKVFGYTRQEVIGKNVKMLMPSPYHENHDDYVGNYMATGVRHIMGNGREVTGLRKNGEQFPMSLGVTEASTTEHRFFVGVVRDLSVEKALQAKLAEKQQFLEDLIDNNEALIYAKDTDGKFLLANRRYEEIVGVSRDSFLGKTDDQFLPVESATRYRNTDALVQESGRVIKTEERFEKLGSEYYFLTTKFPMLDADGKVRAVCAISTDITELKKTQQSLERLSEVDELSTLSNRRHFMLLARQELIKAKRYPEPLSLLMLDIDHFKFTNDTYGHLAGDRVIRVLGQMIRSLLRDADIAGRVGGEEFAALLPNTTLAQAVTVAEKLRLQFAKTPIEAPCGNNLFCTFSVGVAELNSRKDIELEDFMAEAEAGLYQAKQSGRNKVCAA